VLCAKDTETDKFVAIKKVSNIFQTKLSAKRLLREIKLLRALKHENVRLINDALNV